MRGTACGSRGLLTPSEIGTAESGYAWPTLVVAYMLRRPLLLLGMSPWNTSTKWWMAAAVLSAARRTNANWSGPRQRKVRASSSKTRPLPTPTLSSRVLVLRFPCRASRHARRWDWESFLTSSPWLIGVSRPGFSSYKFCRSMIREKTLRRTARPRRSRCIPSTFVLERCVTTTPTSAGRT